MIKAENGDVILDGNLINLFSDYASIVAGMVELAKENGNESNASEAVIAVTLKVINDGYSFEKKSEIKEE